MTAHPPGVEGPPERANVVVKNGQALGYGQRD